MAAVEFIVVGAGIAGLRAALALSDAGRGGVLLLTKGELADSNTSFAQGGIAAALGEDDSVALHEHDTLIAGGGLSRPEAARILTQEGPAAVEDLLRWGAAFDRTGGALDFAREGAHSRSRVLHAHGDSTGREIAETLLRQASARAQIQIQPFLRVAALLSDATTGRVTGVECRHATTGQAQRCYARAILLATGGLGQVYPDTTNPAVATGDGPVLAWRAGAVLADMEFVQFHPTALAAQGAPRFLLSEALRGEGAILRNPAGERFMPGYDPRAELAPRDVVARAIVAEIRRCGGGPDAACYLDASAIGAADLEMRFPRIMATLRHYGWDLGKQPVPVRPAAHYAMGGIWTDLAGRTSLPGLFAAGEAACSGVHGANRLASNSLLEGLVFGARAAQAMSAEPASAHARGEAALAPQETVLPREHLRRRMADVAAVVREGASLRALLRELAPEAGAAPDAAAAPLEDRNLTSVAAAIVRAALARTESRGAHFRTDFPRADPALAGQHSYQQWGQSVTFGPPR
ncbi:MAG: L-aspartate oxidase [Terriglobales bacterium]